MASDAAVARAAPDGLAAGTTDSATGTAGLPREPLGSTTGTAALTRAGPRSAADIGLRAPEDSTAGSTPLASGVPGCAAMLRRSPAVTAGSAPLTRGPAGSGVPDSGIRGNGPESVSTATGERSASEPGTMRSGMVACDGAAGWPGGAPTVSRGTT